MTYKNWHGLGIKWYNVHVSDDVLLLVTNDLRGVVLIKGVWLWVWFYPEFTVPEIWFLRLAGMYCFHSKWCAKFAWKCMHAIASTYPGSYVSKSCAESIKNWAETCVQMRLYMYVSSKFPSQCYTPSHAHVHMHTHTHTYTHTFHHLTVLVMVLRTNTIVVWQLIQIQQLDCQEAEYTLIDIVYKTATCIMHIALMLQENTYIEYYTAEG